MDNTIGYSMVLLSDIKVFVHFFAREKNTVGGFFVEVALYKTESLQYFITKYFPYKQLFENIQERLMTLYDGKAVEHNFFTDVKNYFDKKGVSFYGFKYIRLATIQEDHEGVDVYFGMENGEFPLQLKKEKIGQKLHKQKFPKIPSYVVNDQVSTKDALKLFSKMAEAYQKNDIQHC